LPRTNIRYRIFPIVRSPNKYDHLAERPNFRAPGKSLVRPSPKSPHKFGSYRFLFGHVRSYPRELDFARITCIVTTACLCIGCKWSASRPSPLTPKQRAPSTYGKGGWVRPAASLNSLQKRKISYSRRLSSPQLDHWLLQHQLSY